MEKKVKLVIKAFMKHERNINEIREYCVNGKYSPSL